jgi:ABC-type dipeptide/oligopeptide/nickel transport system ATPase component
MESILEVRNLHVAYSSRAGVAPSAITDVSFDVRSREILGVLGESGSGKSTLVASLLRLLPANGKIQKGSILFEGRDIVHASTITVFAAPSLRGRGSQSKKKAARDRGNRTQPRLAAFGVPIRAAVRGSLRAVRPCLTLFRVFGSYFVPRFVPRFCRVTSLTVISRALSRSSVNRRNGRKAPRLHKRETTPLSHRVNSELGGNDLFSGSLQVMALVCAAIEAAKSETSLREKKSMQDS